MLRRFATEPLVHFAAAGAVLFALYGLVGDDGGDRAGRNHRIVVSREKIDQLATGFARTWQRPPGPKELAGLVKEHLREEVLYREALEMDLDRDDVIVRRRMRQKLEFLLEALEGEAAPTDAELEAFLAEHADEFRVEPSMAFEHVYFRPEGGRETAEAALARARKGASGEPEASGDPTLLPPEFTLAPVGEAGRVFGETFAQALPDLDEGRWDGPVESAYGWHLVRVTERKDGFVPAVAEARDAVAAEWTRRRRAQILDETCTRLLDQYDVVIEGPDAEGGNGNGDGADGADAAGAAARGAAADVAADARRPGADGP